MVTAPAKVPKRPRVFDTMRCRTVKLDGAVGHVEVEHAGLGDVHAVEGPGASGGLWCRSCRSLLIGCLSKYILVQQVAYDNYSASLGTLRCHVPVAPGRPPDHRRRPAHRGPRRPPAAPRRPARRGRASPGPSSTPCCAWPAPTSGRLRLTDLATQLDLSNSGRSRLVDRLVSARLRHPPGLRDRPARGVRRSSPTAASRSSRGHPRAPRPDRAVVHGRARPRRARRPSAALLRKVRDVVNPGATAGS